MSNEAETEGGSEYNTNYGSHRLSSHSAFSDSQIESMDRQHCFAASTVTPVDAAGIRVLLVPVGPVREGRLLHWANAIARFSHIAITDVLPHIDPALASSYGAGAGAGMTAVEGALRFRFSTGGTEEHEHLEGLQTYRQVLGVIGIVDCEACEDVQRAYDEEFAQVLSRHTTAVAYRCLAFDPRPDQLDDVPGVTVIPNAGGSLLFYLQTLLSDFAGTMVSALSLMAGSIEGQAVVESPDQPQFSLQSRAAVVSGRRGLSPTGSAFSEGRGERYSMSENSGAAAIQTTAARRSLAHSTRRLSMPTTPSDGQGESPSAATSSPSGSAGRGRHGGEMDREAVGPQLSQMEQLSQSPTTPAQGRRPRKNSLLANEVEESANAGRLKKLQGDFYLMSGRLAEAFAAYSASINASRKYSDYLWLAVAMEGYCAALLQLCERLGERRNVAGHLASVPKTAVDEGMLLGIGVRSAKPSVPAQPATKGAPSVGAPATSAVASTAEAVDAEAARRPTGDVAELAGLLGQIGVVFGQVPLLYEKCYSFAPLLYAEACVREALVLHATREAFLLDPELALHALLQDGDLSSRRARDVPQMTRDVVANTRNIPLRSAINDWLQRGWASSFASLALTDQLEMSSEISRLFGDIGYTRKSVFFLRQFLLLAVPILLRTSTAQTGEPLNRGGGSPMRPSMTSSRSELAASSAFVDGSSAFAAVSAAAAAASSNSQAMHAPHFQSPVGTPSHLRTTFDAFGAGDSPAVTREWFTRAKVNLRQAVISCLDALVFTFETGSARHNEGNGEKGRLGQRSRFNHGWLHLQADIMRECLSIAEALPSYPHAIAAAFRLVGCLNSLSTIVPEAHRRALLGEQHMLRGYLQRTIALFHQRYHFDPVCVSRGAELPPLPEPLCVAVRRVVGRDALVLGGALDSLLVGVQLCTFPGDHTPIAVGRPAAQAGEPRARSLFLYNPSAAPVQGEVAPALVVHEKAYAVATLINPLPFALHLTDVGLVGRVAGGLVAATTTRCTLPANGQGQVLLEMAPAVAGKLQIAGIKATVFQHLSIVCLLSEENEAEASLRLKERPLQQRLEAERNSLLGVDRPQPNESTVRLTQLNAGCSLNTSVVPALPSLSVVGCSPVYEDRLDLFEGESRVVSLTIVNGSRFAVADRIDVAFEPLAADREARAGDLTNAAFSYLGGSAVVAPGGEMCLRVRVAGIGGLSGGEVIVRYGNVGVGEWSRELRWPLCVSVSRLLVPARGTGGGDFGARYLELPPYIDRALSTDPSQNDAVDGDLLAALNEAMAGLTTDGSLGARDLFCLAEVDIENSGSSDVKLEVEVDLSFDRATDSAALYGGGGRSSPRVSTLGMLLAGRGSVSRIAVPLPRVCLDERVLSAPIPGVEAEGGPDSAVFYPWRTPLSGPSVDDGSWVGGAFGGGSAVRQFVVSKDARLSERDMATRRAAFWYQYEVASRVRVRWTCLQSGRQGFVDPRVLFGIGERALSVVRPAELGVAAFVDGCPARYLDGGLAQMSCPTRRSCVVELVLANRSSGELAVSVDVCINGSDGHAEEAKSVAADVGSKIDMSFVPALLAATAKDGEVPSLDTCGFRFALGDSHTAVAARVLPVSEDGEHRSGEPLVALIAEGAIFDNVYRRDLPVIEPGAGYRLNLPFYALRSGTYEINYTVFDARRPDSHVLAVGTLAVNSGKESIF
ncbi:hypothetical protein GGI18_000191 [Coemansia linderi]|uniref:Uncharacterized protein n=1 Tax=Coemansia linderi TaxID=2663919 RepID=A0ACC1KP91_9FUNG|nr:hypothetical protein GGI18_000191 [Coemansia linderi]